jgi:ankyrin repeat protein
MKILNLILIVCLIGTTAIVKPKPGIDSADIEQNKHEECPMCFEGLNEKAASKSFKCNHILHKDCADDWIRDSQNKDCPTCRQGARDPKDVEIIELNEAAGAGAGADADIAQVGPVENNTNALIEAIKNGDEEYANALIDRGVNLQAITDSGDNLLTLALENWRTNVAMKLIQTGQVDLNFLNNRMSGYTPLMIASESGYLDIVKALLGAGADKHIQNRIGQYAALFAAQNENFDIKNLLMN